jgi:antitoxin component YwqK of YwqJK toxin-antitoxin module
MDTKHNMMVEIDTNPKLETKVEYDNNGRMYEYYVDEKGMKQGICREWYAVGEEYTLNRKYWGVKIIPIEKTDQRRLHREHVYKNDKKEGRYKVWWEDGKLQEEGQYINDVVEGLQRTYSYESGKLQFETNFINGVVEGLSKNWHDDGSVKGLTIRKNGKKEGMKFEWHPNGKIKEEMEYRNDLLNGKHKMWYDNEKLEYECSFKDGKKEGIQKRWSSTGIAYDEQEYHNNILHGKFKRWYENGKLEYEFEYADDKLVNVLELNDVNGRSHVLKEGVIETWKACKAYNNFRNIFVFVRLLIPVDAKRVTVADNQRIYKSRVSKAKVMEIFDENGNKYDNAFSFVHGSDILQYVVGQDIESRGFNPNPIVECGEGINVHLYRDLCQVWKMYM